jgi:hypothetical protein
MPAAIKDELNLSGERAEKRAPVVGRIGCRLFAQPSERGVPTRAMAPQVDRERMFRHQDASSWPTFTRRSQRQIRLPLPGEVILGRPKLPAAVGVLGGLIGLAGPSFRLPLLISMLGFAAVTRRPPFSPPVRVWGFRISQSHRGRVALCRSGW